MTTISESELTLLIKSKGLKRLLVIQSEDRKYRVAATLNNQEGELELVTYRKKPREWASLDRLAKHIQDRYEGVTTMTLNLSTGAHTK